MRLPVIADGKTKIRLVNGSGRAIDEFADDPATSHMTLVREDVYGLNSLLVERNVATSSPVLLPNSTLSSSSGVGFSGSIAAPATAIVDVRTPSGYQSAISGVAPDASGVFWIPESSLVGGQENWVRVKISDSATEPYSNPVVVSVDTTVTSASANQVRILSIGRDGTNFAVRWALGQSNGKKFNVYFTRTDTNQAALLTLQGVSATSRQFIIPDQALASPCGFFSVTQTNSSGGSETSPSVGASLPPAKTFAALGASEPGCGTAPSPPTSGYSFADEYHHRDHLGSLRVVTDSGGWKLRGHDYYPFGRDLVFPGSALNTNGAKRFTGHDRDFDSDDDHMVLRDKPLNYGFFASPDPVLNPSPTAPFSWNQYAYVRSNPINVNDPMGALFPGWQSCFVCTSPPTGWEGWGGGWGDWGGGWATGGWGGGGGLGGWFDGAWGRRGDQSDCYYTQGASGNFYSNCPGGWGSGPVDNSGINYSGGPGFGSGGNPGGVASPDPDPCANATLLATGVDIYANIAQANTAVSFGYLDGTRFSGGNPFGGMAESLYNYDQLVHTGGPQDVKHWPGPGTRQQRVDAGNISFGVTCPFGASFCQFAAGFAQTMSGHPDFRGTLFTGFDAPSDNAAIRVGQAMRAAGCRE